MSFSQTTLALITRPTRAAKHTASSLKKLGIDSFIEPLLEITHLPNAKHNIKKLLNKTGAIIVTSSNALYALHDMSIIPSDTPFITVGQNTSKTASRLGFCNVKSAQGNLKTLEQFITANYDPKDDNFIYASADVITSDLKLDGFNIKRVVVYNSTPAKKLSDQCTKLLEDRAFSCILFYSVQTSKAFARMETEKLYDNTYAFCLSDKVASPIKNLGFKEIIVAESPNSKALLELICNFKFT